MQAIPLSLTPFFSSLPSSQLPLPSSPASADSLGRPLIVVLSEKPLRASMQGRSPQASPAVLPLPPWPCSLSGLLHSTLSHLTRLSYEQINHACKELSQLAPIPTAAEVHPTLGIPALLISFRATHGAPQEKRARGMEASTVQPVPGRQQKPFF